MNETQNAESQTGLSIQDLSLVVQIIQAASARGAIKADEMAVVGSLHDRLVAFLNSVGAAAQQPATPEASPDQSN